MLACFYALLHVCLSRSRLCHAFCPPLACACRSLGALAYVVASVPLMASLDVTTCEPHLRDFGMLDTHCSLLCAMLICLPCLLCATRLAFFAPLHLYKLAYMFKHEFVCRPYTNLMEPWTLDPNLHLSSKDTHFCLIICLFALVWLSLIVCLLACFLSSSFFVGLLACFLSHCMYTLGVWTLGTRVRPRNKGKDASKKTQAHKGQCLVD